MADYGDGYEPFSTHPEQMQHVQLQQQAQMPSSADGLGSDPYNNQLFTDPRYQVPPNFLDEPPRGPDGMSMFNSSDPQYLPPQANHDAAWGNYLRLPTGQTPPANYPAHPPPSDSSQYYSQAGPSQSYHMPYPLPYPNNSDPTADELTGFPAMSLESHYDDPTNPRAPQMQTEQADQSHPERPTQLRRTSSHTAVIALPGQPPPFGPLFYSSSGFDMISVLTRVANRKNPQVVLGAVDFTCSFVVSDAQAEDEPIVYASPTFVSTLLCRAHGIATFSHTIPYFPPPRRANLRVMRCRRF